MSNLPPPITSEAEVPDYLLPPLGQTEETRALFENHVYGCFPPALPQMSVEVIEEDSAALEGLAHRQQLRMVLSSGNTRMEFVLLLYTPAAATGGVPAFLGLNFFGNHTVHLDPSIALPSSWCPADESKGVINHRATAAGRGVLADRWPIESILNAGYGLATVYCGDFAPDHPDHVGDGVLAFYPPETSDSAADSRGAAVSAWAWGLSRALDALMTLPKVNSERVAVIGFSRLGKAALWAGACDERFALVISTDSGCTGAALARRRLGERPIHINHSFPHWFAKKYRSYNEEEQNLPVDQHQLIALIAPRAVYVASASEDLWADPRGEYLALAAAAQAWGEQLPAESPGVNSPLHRNKLGYHLREGIHSLAPYDWSQFLTFASRLWSTPSSPS